MIKHLDGVCHVYIDDSADPEMAVRIADNAKTQRYGTCNTMETLLVAEAIAPRVLPRIGEIFLQRASRCADPVALKYVNGKKASEDDYYTEWLAPIVSIRVVKGLDEAIEHITKYGSQHTDAIVAQDRLHAERFLREVDSSSVMWNASTRFADGYEYGLGARSASPPTSCTRGPVGPRGPDHAEIRGPRARRNPHLSVGILGGTFDPVHNAHLAMARAALDKLKLEKILFMPTGAPRYRKPAVASGEHRVAMLELALQGEPRYEIDAAS